MRVAVLSVLPRRVRRSGSGILRTIVTIAGRMSVRVAMIGWRVGRVRLPMAWAVVPTGIVGTRACHARLLFATHLIAANRVQMAVLLAQRIVHRRRSASVRIHRVQIVAPTEDFLTAIAATV